MRGDYTGCAGQGLEPQGSPSVLMCLALQTYLQILWMHQAPLGLCLSSYFFLIHFIQIRGSSGAHLNPFRKFNLVLYAHAADSVFALRLWLIFPLLTPNIFFNCNLYSLVIRNCCIFLSLKCKNFCITSFFLIIKIFTKILDCKPPYLFWVMSFLALYQVHLLTIKANW